MNKEISIYFPPGQFIYTVWDANGQPLYVGGTENINGKSFSFGYPFANITGYYYKFPDFTDEIDREICNKKPRYNTYLRSSYTRQQIESYIRRHFYQRNIPFRAAEKNKIGSMLCECETIEFKGELYYSSMDRDIALYEMLEDYGIHGI